MMSNLQTIYNVRFIYLWIPYCGYGFKNKLPDEFYTHFKVENQINFDLKYQQCKSDSNPKIKMTDKIMTNENNGYQL